MDNTLIRFLTRPVTILRARPTRRARRVLWLLLAGWAARNVADWLTTMAVLARGGFHEDYPVQGALLARGSVAALTGYKVLVIAGGSVLMCRGFRLWPRNFVALIALCELLVAVAVANNGFWLVRR